MHISLQAKPWICHQNFVQGKKKEMGLVENNILTTFELTFVEIYCKEMTILELSVVWRWYILL